MDPHSNSKTQTFRVFRNIFFVWSFEIVEMITEGPYNMTGNKIETKYRHVYVK